MYLIVIAWIYVVLMMSVAEATNSNGTVLGAIVTFFMYGVGPAALVAYLMGTPARKRAIKTRESVERADAESEKLAGSATTGGTEGSAAAPHDPPSRGP
jgi:hypothetical protein